MKKGEIKLRLTSGKVLVLTQDELRELWNMGEREKIFAVTFHYWFQDSKYFETYYMKMPDEYEARKEALVIKEQNEDTFNRCAFTILEVFPDQVDVVGYPYQNN